MSVIRVENLSKSYGKVRALRQVSFEVAEGEIFGVVGPDGAGKSSLFNILTTLLLPDSGNAYVFDKDIRKDYLEIRKHIGYLPGTFSLYPDLTVEENLIFFATMYQSSIRDNMVLIKPIWKQLLPFKKRFAGKLSGGMKQKLALCCALIHKPSLLFLDEPTTGVDPVSRKEFWEILRSIKNQGITVVVSTPYMDEASLCDRIAMILDGSVIGLGSPAEIISRYPNRIYSVSGGNMFQTLGALRGVRGVLDCSSFGSACHVSVTDDGPDETGLAEALRCAGIEGCDVRRMTPGIEDCFIRLSSSAAEGSSGAE